MAMADGGVWLDGADLTLEPHAGVGWGPGSAPTVADCSRVEVDYTRSPNLD